MYSSKVCGWIIPALLLFHAISFCFCKRLKIQTCFCKRLHRSGKLVSTRCTPQKKMFFSYYTGHVVAVLGVEGSLNFWNIPGCCYRCGGFQVWRLALTRWYKQDAKKEHGLFHMMHGYLRHISLYLHIQKKIYIYIIICIYIFIF